MEAKFNTKLLQEGTDLTGESLPEQCSGRPVDSGGGKISPYICANTNTSTTIVDSQINPFTKAPRLARSPKLPPGAPLTQQNQCLLQENQLKTQNEIQLWNAWQQALTTINAQQDNINQLILRVQRLEKPGAKPEENQKIEKKIQYSTDEEDLARETEWIVHKSRKNKKRKANTSPETSPLQQPLTSKQSEKKPQYEKKPPVPPPINLVNINNYEQVQHLIHKANVSHKVTAMNNGIFKVNVPDEDQFRRFIAVLREEQIEYFTFENKQDRPMKVMARGLHPTCPPLMIIDDLTRKGFKVTQATNILKKEKNNNTVTKKPLPLFMLSFDKTEDSKKIFAIEPIAGMKVKIEPMRKKTALIPQCKKCQTFGHTQAYCNREPRCVKCAGKHLTTNCTATRLENPKCTNCGEAHPANYRGCIIAKELQKRRDKTLQERNRNNQRTTAAQQTAALARNPQNFPTLPNAGPAPQQSTAGNSYAQKVQNKSQQGLKEEINLNAINKTLQAILGKLDKQENSITSILNRVTKLESNNKAAAKTRNKNGVF